MGFQLPKSQLDIKFQVLKIGDINIHRITISITFYSNCRVP